MTQPSDPDLLANAPGWMSSMMHRFEEALRLSAEREQERVDKQHRGLNNLQKSNLALEHNVQRNLDQIRQEIVTAKKYFAQIEDLLREMESRITLKVEETERRVWEKIVDLEERMSERFKAVEARVTELELRRVSE